MLLHCNNLLELNPSDYMFHKSWEGSSANVNPHGSTELCWRPLSPQNTIHKAVRTTQEKLQTQHVDENNFRKHGHCGRPVPLELHLLVFFLVWSIFFPSPTFSPLLSFLNLSIYLFPYSCVHCFLISFPSLPAACQWKMVHPRWESWMTEAFLILLLLVHWTTQKEKLPLLLLVQFV